MADMHHLIQADGVDAAAAYTALTTQEGITAWWTKRAVVEGDELRMSFPDAPMTWDMRVVTAEAPSLIEWDCFGGPPGWTSTHLKWQIEKAGDAVIVRLDHAGFPAVDDMFRVVTVGWAQMLLSLKAYLESGVAKPFFDF